MGKVIKGNFPKKVNNKYLIDNYYKPEDWNDIERSFDEWYRAGQVYQKVVFTGVLLLFSLVGIFLLSLLF